MERNVELEIPVLLPGVQDADDQCLNRLEGSLQNRKGIVRAHLKRDRSPVELCLHYDPNLLGLNDVKNMAERAGAQIVQRYQHDSMDIEGMDCSDCVTVIEHGIGRMDGVLSVRVNYAANRMWVEYDRKHVSRAAIVKRVRSLGYTIPDQGMRSWFSAHRELLFSGLAGVCLITGWVGAVLFGWPFYGSLGFYLAAYFFGGWDVSRHAWHAIREKHFDTDLLMIIAALGAASLGEFAEGALLLFLFSLGHALEERALDRARSAVRTLADLTPQTAIVRAPDGEREVPVESLQLDDRVIVLPGVRIPADGIVAEGRSGVNQAPITGESLPVDKTAGDSVYAGTINGEGALEVRVTRLARDSTLARVMRMVEEAQAQKSPTQATVERFERVFVPSVFGVTLLVIVLPPLLGFPFRESFLRAMTLLVAASPCALALGTPATVLAAVARAARNGVLIKGGVHLENLGRIKAIAFDKTGTITLGQPAVTDVVAYGMEQQELLSLAAAVESRSAHPLARAVVRMASARGTNSRVADQVESLSGRGMRATVDGMTLVLGSEKLMHWAGVELPAEALEQAEAWRQEGKTLMWVAVDRTLAGILALADPLRPEANAAMQALAALGLERTIMLTGDNARAAAAIGQRAGLLDFRADLLPEDKSSVIRDLEQEFGPVAMVGDGVNDAPALANATVGIAMGGAGTDAALETADVALMSDDLSKLPFAIGLGRASRAVINQNIAIAMGVIVLLIGASLTGVASMAVAVAFHEGSTLVVVANALRLLRYKED